MKLLRSFVIVAGAALALTATPDRAQAAGLGVPCIGCKGGGGRDAGPAPQRSTLFGSFQGFGAKQKLPAFQAAPWYQYWPYDGHFMTPAPVGGAFYGPPMTGNFPVNPYFPGGPGMHAPHPMPGPGR